MQRQQSYVGAKCQVLGVDAVLKLQAHASFGDVAWSELAFWPTTRLDNLYASDTSHQHGSHNFHYR
jgi:hypothetical protein